MRSFVLCGVFLACVLAGPAFGVAFDSAALFQGSTLPSPGGIDGDAVRDGALVSVPGREAGTIVLTPERTDDARVDTQQQLADARKDTLQDALAVRVGPANLPMAALPAPRVSNRALVLSTSLGAVVTLHRPGSLFSRGTFAAELATSPSLGGGATIPEPGTGLLVAVGLGALAVRHRG